MSITLKTHKFGLPKDEIFEKVTEHLYLADLHTIYTKEILVVIEDMKPRVIGVIDSKNGGGFKPYRAYTTEDEKILAKEIPVKGGITAGVLEIMCPGELAIVHNVCKVVTE